MGKLAPNANPETIDELIKISSQLDKLNERACNEGLTPRSETRYINLQNRAEILATELGTRVYFNGDPRGCSIYLYFPDTQCYDDIDRDKGYNGWGVPTVY